MRFGSPLGVYDFVTRTSIIRYSADALARHERAVCAFARLEGLEAHARAVEARLPRALTVADAVAVLTAADRSRSAPALCQLSRR